MKVINFLKQNWLNILLTVSTPFTLYKVTTMKTIEDLNNFNHTGRWTVSILIVGFIVAAWTHQNTKPTSSK